jgi:hypothetical protein
MRWARRRVASAAFLAAAAASLRAPGVSADEGDTTADTSYGRVDGDLTFAVGLGAAFGSEGPRGAGDLRVRYLESAGVFAGYEERAALDSSADLRRVVSTGVELRPFFFLRWLQGHETRRARWDMLVDSIGLELGGAFVQPAGGGFASQPGVQAGLGIEAPLLERASGPWIAVHGGVRWFDQGSVWGGMDRARERAAFVTITLALHAIVLSHVVELGDEAPQ